MGYGGTMRWASLLMGIAWLVLARPGFAANESWRVEFDLDNDVVIAGEDRHYTSGVRLFALAPSNWLPDWIAKLACVLPSAPEDGSAVRWGMGIEQQIYTPENSSARAVVEDDRPYAGYLHGRFGVYREHAASDRESVAWLDTLELDLGVVGPAALGEQAQDVIHEVFPSPRFEGWDNQLDNEFAFVLRGARDWRLPGKPLDLVAGLALDAIANATVELGNVKTAASAGLRFRIGWRLPADFAAARFSPRDGPGMPTRFYLFGGASLSAVVRDIFLDGNSFEESHHVDKRPLVLQAPMGFGFERGRFKTQLSVIFNSEAFEGQAGPDWYGRWAIVVDY